MKEVETRYTVYMHLFDEEGNLSKNVVFFSGIGEDSIPKFEQDMSKGVLFDSIFGARFLLNYINFRFPYNGVSIKQIEVEKDSVCENDVDDERKI